MAGVDGRAGFVAVLEVPAADPFEQWRGGQEYRCRGALFCRLPPGAGQAAGLGDHPIELFGADVALEASADPAGHQGVDGDAVRRPSLGRLDREEDVRRLGLPVGQPGLVRALAEVDVLEDNGRAAVGAGADRDDAGVPGGRQWVVQAGGQGEMPQVVRGELQLPALRGPGERCGHDAGVVDQDMQGPSQFVVKAATEAGSARSSGDTRTCLLPVLATMSSAVRAPASTLRTAGVTSVLALTSARAVSTPIPARCTAISPPARP
jgi:hypothetical protein